MKSPKIGNLRNRITFQNKLRVSDSAGGYTTSWEDYANVWAEVKALSGLERLKAEQQYVPVTHKVIVRYSPSKPYDASMRILFDSREFAIKKLVKMDEGRTEWIEIIATESDPS